jgi:hypothetical protein
MAGLNRRQMRAAIDAREDCINSTGSMRGRIAPRTAERGQLNDAEWSRLLNDLTAGVAYIVYSYETPIAWVTDDGFKYRVQQRFSKTTSCHMGMTWRGDNEK